MDYTTCPAVILIADDDEDDFIMSRDALKRNKIRNEVYWVKNGIELLEYLRHQGEYSDSAASPRPQLVLLDINMPKMNGLEALKEIRQDPDLRHIPVVALTTSKSEEDVIRSYDLGVNSFVTKPVEFDGLVNVMHGLQDYWFQIVRIPDPPQIL